MPILELKKIDFREQEYVLELTCPADLFPYVQEAIKSFFGLAKDMRRMGQVSRAQTEGVARIEAEKKVRDDKVRIEIEETYEAAFAKSNSERESLKIINRKFKAWWWLREEFAAQIVEERNLTIKKLKLQGLNSREIAEKVGVHPGTIRRVMSSWKKN